MLTLPVPNPRAQFVRLPADLSTDPSDNLEVNVSDPNRSQNSDSLQQNGYHPLPTVNVTQTEFDSLKAIAKQYGMGDNGERNWPGLT